MANFNKVYLIGNLTRDPELCVTPRGTAICQFGLAINREWQSKGQGEDSEKQSETTFVDVEAWGKQGEAIAKYCTKGKSLFVEGRLKLDSWEDKASGQKRSKLKVVLEGFQFIGGREPNQGESAPQSQSALPLERHSAPAVKHAAPGENLDEDVPF